MGEGGEGASFGEFSKAGEGEEGATLGEGGKVQRVRVMVMVLEWGWWCLSLRSESCSYAGGRKRKGRVLLPVAGGGTSKLGTNFRM